MKNPTKIVFAIVLLLIVLSFCMYFGKRKVDFIAIQSQNNIIQILRMVSSYLNETNTNADSLNFYDVLCYKKGDSSLFFSPFSPQKIVNMESPLMDNKVKNKSEFDKICGYYIVLDKKNNELDVVDKFNKNIKLGIVKSLKWHCKQNSSSKNPFR